MFGNQEDESFQGTVKSFVLDRLSNLEIEEPQNILLSFRSLLKDQKKLNHFLNR